MGKTLLRIVRSSEGRHPAGVALGRFCADYNIGIRRGDLVLFTERDRQDIAHLLKGRMGVDPASTAPEDWGTLSRAESLLRGKDEKFAGRAVGEGRLRVKASPGRPLRLAGGEWTLPDRMDLGVDLDAVLSWPLGHDAILVVENLQSFDDFHRVDPALMSGMPADDPMIVYRGDAQGGARVDAVHALAVSASLPVVAFVDFDPAGLVIASSLPGLSHVLAPEPGVLREAIERHGLAERYVEQEAAFSGVLDRSPPLPCVAWIWKILRETRKALPQERFHEPAAG